MEYFDDLLKKKVEEKTHDFHFSNWKSFCLKAGINPFLASLNLITITSISVAVVSSIIVSVTLFMPQNQSVSATTPEDFSQIIHIDTCCDAEPAISDCAEMEISVNEELATVFTPIKRTEKVQDHPAKDEDKIVPIVEQKVVEPPKKIENIRGGGMRIDTIKSDNQLMEW